MARSESFHFADDKGRAYSDTRCEAYRADTKALLETQYTDSNGDVTFTALVTGVDAHIYVYHHNKADFHYNFAPPNLGDCGGDLDDITDGGTYGKVEINQLTSNRITLSGADGDLDDVSDGSSYAKVLNTDITAGHILLTECTGDLDDIANGTYGKVLSTDITSGHIELGECIGSLGSISDGGTYGKLRLTDMTAGHIKLTTNVVVDGEWYDESGVEIDSAAGINIYGTDAAFTTRATKTGTIQCKVDSSGNISAGAGTVLLNSGGISIKGAVLTLTDSAGNNSGTLYIDTSGNLKVDSWTNLKANIILLGTSIVSDPTPGYATIGTTVKYFVGTYGTYAALKEITTPGADADWGKIYTKNDNLLYFQDGAGNEHVCAFV